MLLGIIFWLVLGEFKKLWGGFGWFCNKSGCFFGWFWLVSAHLGWIWLVLDVPCVSMYCAECCGCFFHDLEQMTFIKTFCSFSERVGLTTVCKPLKL